MDYQERLDKHDWHYDKSDDPEVYRKGEEELAKLRVIASISEQFKAMYVKKFQEVYKTKAVPWIPPKA